MTHPTALSSKISVSRAFSTIPVNADDFCFRIFLKIFSGTHNLPGYVKDGRRSLMTKVLIALLAIYAVWSSYRILLLSAMIHSIARILEEFLAVEE